MGEGMMRYSIITPTLCRPTLKRLCDSIDAQTNGDWEHIVVVDVPPPKFNAERQENLDAVQKDARRKFHYIGKPHQNDCGNSARRFAFAQAVGEYIFYIDDDDYFSDDNVLQSLEKVTGDWAIFPVLSRGKRCFHDPPGIHKTGSCMFVSKRVCQPIFPENNDYSADGQVVEALKKNFRYQAFPDMRPLVIYEQANHGEFEIVPEAKRKSRGGLIRYASDGLTIDWNDYN
ncbi:MAG: hypothetical protein C5B59_08760 [Bacteroidetes bacterium]|nr:MAG: hypothetical protein C5B59_08760 [Bacteroidota bacterium]